jgi:NitT/TauT family transport system permease protein
MARAVTQSFGGAQAAVERPRRFRTTDLALVAAVPAAVFAVVRLAQQWTGTLRPTVEIDLALRALPGYAALSLSRGLAAYVLSLAFTLVYGYWAAKDRVAERVLIPALDILQSIPVLSFMPGLVLGLVAIFPRSNAGLELASVLMIFTGQAWNMTFSFYHALRSLPRDLTEVATLNRFGWWQRFRWVELPFSAIGLVWNSMMSMAGGWFFLMVSEAFVLGQQDFRLPGLGSYMSVAVARGDGRAMAAAVAAMTIMIVALDQLLWRPVVVWAQKFRVEESGQAEAMESWFLDVLRRSRILPWLEAGVRSIGAVPGEWVRRRAQAARARPARPRSRVAGRASGALFALLLAFLAAGVVGLVHLLQPVTASAWLSIAGAALLTLLRVLAATALGTAWALPAGLAIGLSPRLSRILQPVVQVVASFPAPMLFPAVVAVLAAAGVGLGTGSVVLMLLGTQWYVLFNVVAGATAIPADLREAARLYRLPRWQRFRVLYLPAVFPYLVTGWVTAAGGAWNASIVSEYVAFRGTVLATHGLGARISLAAGAGDFSTLAAASTVMALMVVLFNRLVWRRLHRLGEERFSLAR